jgi:hypothetical protein
MRANRSSRLYELIRRIRSLRQFVSGIKHRQAQAPVTFCGIESRQTQGLVYRYM